MGSWAAACLPRCLAEVGRVFKRGDKLFLFSPHLRVKCRVVVEKCHIVITLYLDASCNLSLNTPLLMLLLRLPSLPLKRPSSVYV